jgi:hypothetical protein
MARVAGDKNYSLREDRLKAENAALKLQLKACEAQNKVEKARQRELRETIDTLRKKR